MALNILIVDDSSVVRAMVAKALRLAKVPVGQLHQASNGQEGLDVLADHWVDLVLADINMPVMNGEEMIQRIRARPEWDELPILVLSTEGSRTRIERLRRHGVAFIRKPFQPEDLQKVVQQLTGITNAQQA